MAPLRDYSSCGSESTLVVLMMTARRFIDHSAPLSLIPGLLCACLCLSLFPATLSAEATANIKKHVLVLNSYQKGYSWTDNIVQAIEDAFRDETDVILHVEYMDTKKINSERHFQLLRELFANKYQDTRFDVIIASDDDALQFLQKYGPVLFPETPVVFCGITNYTPAKSAGLHHVTGVIEAADPRSTLELIRRLQPTANTIYLIGDQLTTGRMIREEFDAVAANYTRQWRFVYLDNHSMRQVLEIVRGLGPGAAVVYLSFFRDAAGATYDPSEAIPLITASSSVPVYGQVDYMIGKGILGGMVKSSYYQGKIAAELAQRILELEPASDIPIVMDSPNAYLFDYRQLTRFGMPLRALPPGSLIINEPENFYYRYQGLIWTVLSVVALLLLFIVVLLLNIQKRKRAQQGLEDILDAMKNLFEHGSIDRLKIELGRIIRRVVFLDRKIESSRSFNYKGNLGGFDQAALVSLTGADGPLDKHTADLIHRSIQGSSCVVQGKECVALFKNSSIPGNVLYMRGDRRFDSMDRDLLEILSNNVSMAIEALEKSKIQESLDTARIIQQSMLPRDFTLARSQGWVELYATLLAAKEVGGDLYDFFTLDEHHFCFVIGDVSGKGVPAALFMVMAKTLIRSAAEHDPRPAVILAKANNELARDNEQSMFVTLFLAILDRRSGLLSYANGGHNPPYVIGQDGDIRPLPLTGGIALGVVEGIDYRCDSIQLAPGDGLFFYTDGVTEAINPSDEEFGTQRLEKVLETHGAEPAEVIVAATLDSVQRFASTAPQFDDITLMFFRWIGASR
jgi:serine phosphatase RsbU (regulator of sigma subunit)/ABC-type uncharacterized transport system substrate-binding protein